MGNVDCQRQQDLSKSGNVRSKRGKHSPTTKQKVESNHQQQLYDWWWITHSKDKDKLEFEDGRYPARDKLEFEDGRNPVGD